MDTLNVSRSNGTATITLDRPHRKNAIDRVMWTELLGVLREISQNHLDRVVVITGSGADFCSGADLGGEVHDTDGHHLSMMRFVGDVALALYRLPQPVIAKVRGFAVGAGCNLALGCDLVVASDTAKFSEIFSRRGLSIDFGGSWLLPRRIGLHRAKEMALFGDIYDARRAEEIGLVNRVLPDDELDGFVDEWAARLVAGPPIALAQTKRLLNEAMNQTMEGALDDEGAAQTVNSGTTDTVEAMKAFVEKRQPTFHGR